MEQADGRNVVDVGRIGVFIIRLLSRCQDGDHGFDVVAVVVVVVRVGLDPPSRNLAAETVPLLAAFLVGVRAVYAGA